MVAMGVAATLRERLGDGWQVEVTADAVLASAPTEGGTAASVRVQADRETVVGVIGIGGWPAFSRHEAGRLVDVVVAAASEHGASHLRLRSADQVVRHEARSKGFAGGLREDLLLDTAGVSSPSEGAASELGPAIESLLPGTRVTATASANPLRRLLERAVSGSGAQTRVDIADGWDGFRVRVPDRADLMPEAIAMAADTAMAIRVRFGPALRHVKAMSFDLAVHGMSQHKVAGAAHHEVPEIHLSAVMGCADLAAAAQAQAGRNVPRRPSAATRAQFRIDKVTAHEFGHQLDFAFQAGRYGESIEFRRRLGHVLGVDSLEVAFRGGDPLAPPAGRRLAEEVSLYATTNMAEAMAELFAVWWFSDGQGSDLVAAFGDLVQQYFPPGR